MRWIVLLSVLAGSAAEARLAEDVWDDEGADALAFDLAEQLRRGFEGQDPGGLARYLAGVDRTGSARLLIDGADSFEAREALVRSARRSIVVEQLYWPMGLRTARLMAMMAARVEDGVTVRILVDRLGTSLADRPWLAAFDRWVRSRYRALAERYPHFATELARTDSSVVLWTTPQKPLSSEVVEHDEERGVLRRVRREVPSLGRANLLHFSHAKMIVADRARAITGGINHSDLYAARGRVRGEPGPLTDRELSLLRQALPDQWAELTARFGERLDRPEVSNARGWRDTDVLVTGPIAGDFADSFERMWALSALATPTDAGETLAVLGVPPPIPWRPDGPKPFVPPDPALPRRPSPTIEGVSMRKVEHIPRLGEAYMLRQTRWLLGSARREVTCHVPYLLMPEVQERWLAQAARRGVTVRLITNGPDSNDIHRAVAWAARAQYGRLMRQAGPNLRIYEWQGPPLHSKVCLADGLVTVVGSNNRDVISQHFSSELGVTITSRAFAKEARRMLAADLRSSRRVTRREATRWRATVEGTMNIGPFDWSAIAAARALRTIAAPFMRGQVRLRAFFRSL